jgi:hypothetical protein
MPAILFTLLLQRFHYKVLHANYGGDAVLFGNKRWSTDRGCGQGGIYSVRA